MTQASVRELRNQGGQVLDRVISGEIVTITRDGHPVAQLVPIGRTRLSAEAIIQRFSNLPSVDPERLRQDIDNLIDQSL